MAGAWRTVRVFVSSTFRDMHAERDHLVRFVFPKLRLELARRRINLIEYDLRWGVTEDDDAVAVCRDIIDECRPRFICLLGGRYGWVPEGLDRSITADEILYAAFDNQRLEHQFFYFRDPAVTESMDEKNPGEFREPVGSSSEKMLADLKLTIEEAGFVPYTYSARWDGEGQRLVDLDDFGDQVYQDLLKSIDEELGQGTPAPVGPFEEENAQMDLFAEMRTQRYVLGSRDVILDQMINFSKSESGSRGMMVTGPSGNGKSALLAVAYRFLKNDPMDFLTVLHFVGASPQSVTVRGMLRRLCHELSQSIGLKPEIPDETEQLVTQFQSLLNTVSLERRVVLVLDALNQLSPDDNAYRLNWLPRIIPENVRLIVSSTNHQIAESLSERNDFETVELQPITSDDAEQIIGQFLGRFGKQVDRIQLELLLEKEDAGSPLYLLIALEELRTLGQYELMTKMIRELPGSTRDLLIWLFDTRLSNDPGFRDGDDNQIGAELVRRFAGFMGTSRTGLSSQELVSLVDVGDPRGNVAALERLLIPYCIRRGNLIDFQHQKFKDVIKELYLQDADAVSEFHRELLLLFTTLADPDQDESWKGDDPRVFRELPYHAVEFNRVEPLVSLVEGKFFTRFAELLGNGEALAVTEKLAELFVQNLSRESVLKIAYVYCEISERTNVASRLESVIRAGDVESALALIKSEQDVSRRELMRIAAIEIFHDSGQIDVAKSWAGSRKPLNHQSLSNSQIRIAESLEKSQTEDESRLLRPLYPPVDEPWQSVDESDLDSSVTGQPNFSLKFRFWLNAFPYLLLWSLALGAIVSLVQFGFITWDETETIEGNAFVTTSQLGMLGLVGLLIAAWALGRPYLRKNLTSEVSRLCIDALQADHTVRRNACRKISTTYWMLIDYENAKWKAEPSRDAANPFIRRLVTRTAQECESEQEFAEFVIDVSARQLRPLVVDDLIIELRKRSREYREKFRISVLELSYRSNHFFILQLLIDSAGPELDSDTINRLLEDVHAKEEVEQIPLELSKVDRVSLARALLSSVLGDPKNISSVGSYFAFKGEVGGYWGRFKRAWELPFWERLGWITFVLIPIIGTGLASLTIAPALIAMIIPALLAMARVRDTQELLKLDSSLEGWNYFGAIDNQINSISHLEDLFPPRKRTIQASGLVAMICEGGLAEYFSAPAKYDNPEVIRRALRRASKPDLLGNDDTIVLRLMGQRELLDEFANQKQTPVDTNSNSADVTDHKSMWKKQMKRVMPIKSAWGHFLVMMIVSLISISLWTTVFCWISPPNIEEYFRGRGGIILAIWTPILVLMQIVFRRYYLSRICLIALVVIYMMPAYLGIKEAGITRWEFYVPLMAIFSTHWVAPVSTGYWRGTDLLFPTRSELLLSKLRAIVWFLVTSILLGFLLKLMVWLSYSPFWIF